MHDFRLRLPDDLLEYFKHRPEIKLSSLVELLVRDDLDLNRERKAPGPVFGIRLSDKAWAGIIRTGKPPVNYIRELLHRYIEETL